MEKIRIHLIPQTERMTSVYLNPNKIVRIRNWSLFTHSHVRNHLDNHAKLNVYLLLSGLPLLSFVLQHTQRSSFNVADSSFTLAHIANFHGISILD